MSLPGLPGLPGLPESAQPVLRLMLGGDAMLGRTVSDRIAQHGPAYPLGGIGHLLRGAHLAVVNLECALTARRRHWNGAPKAFYFGAQPAAVEALAGAGVAMASLANNHTLDFGVSGLFDTISLLDARGIAHAGAGGDRSEAERAAVVRYGDVKLGMAAFCDHQSDFAAQLHAPGIAYLDLDNEAAAILRLRSALAPLCAAGVAWPVLSLHWGPNMVRRPSSRFRRLAHAAVDMGWKILFGHSAHVFQGVELYRGCPILYAAGDLVDDYHVDPQFRNDHQLLFELALGPAQVQRIVLHPIFIHDCRSVPANPIQRRYIFDQMRMLCSELGTPVRERGEVLVIEPVAA